MSTGLSPADAPVLSDPEVGLMLRVRDDDAAAFAELMDRYQSRVLTLLEHLVGARHLAEDLTQEAFLRVYRARRSYAPEAKFSTWLFTIVNNVAANALRSRARRREVHVQPAETNASGALGLDMLALAASGAMPTRVADRAEMCAVVQTAVAHLSERQRMAVLLCKFEGLSYEEIAAAMQLTPTAVKSLLARARENLRLLLAPYLDAGQPVEKLP